MFWLTARRCALHELITSGLRFVQTRQAWATRKVETSCTNKWLIFTEKFLQLKFFFVFFQAIFRLQLLQFAYRTCICYGDINILVLLTSEKKSSVKWAHKSNTWKKIVVAWSCLIHLLLKTKSLNRKDRLLEILNQSSQNM